jgi:hypothetical protein
MGGTNGVGAAEPHGRCGGRPDNRIGSDEAVAGGVILIDTLADQDIRDIPGEIAAGDG